MSTPTIDTPYTIGMLDYSMEKLPTTIEALAAMINTHMASKEDIKEVKEDGSVAPHMRNFTLTVVLP